MTSTCSGIGRSTIDITVRACSGRSVQRSDPQTSAALEGVEVCDIDGLTVTTPAQTALDLARLVPHVNAVAIVDQAIRAEPRRRPAHDAWRRSSRLMGSCRRIAATPERSGRSPSPMRVPANVRESQSRVGDRCAWDSPSLGLQERRVLPSGRRRVRRLLLAGTRSLGRARRTRASTCSPGVRRRSPAAVRSSSTRRIARTRSRREVRGFSRWEPG